MTLGFYSPLPPAHTGVADYAAALLAEMRKYGEVEVAPEECDAALYHLGNNQLHADIYFRALQRPGVVVLHDAVLQHFLLGQLSDSEYSDEFAYNYGDWNRDLGDQLWRERAGSGSDERYFRYPMLKRIAQRSRAVVVHNPAAARAVREHAPKVRVVEIPHLFQSPELPGEADIVRYRQRLGIDPATFVFGVFGYLRESKRLMAVLETFRVLHRKLPQTALIVAGEFVSTDLARAVEPLLGLPGVIRLPFLEESRFWLTAGAVDACINLRYPPAGESSGIVVRMMGIGKPVLVTGSEETSSLPESACVRIAAGAAERDSLLVHMTLLTSVPGVAGAVGMRGAAHIAEHHRVEWVSRKYWDVVRESCTSL